MPRHKRKAIPLGLKVAIVEAMCWRQSFILPIDSSLASRLSRGLDALGFAPDAVIQWDHDPPLELRPDNEAGTDYEPAQLDPRYIFPMLASDHKAKTTGRKGESKLSISGNGDKSRIDKVKRIRAKAALTPYDRAMGEIMRWPKEEPQPKPKRKRSWPARKLESRGFEKKQK